LGGGFVATSDRIRSETPAPIHTFNAEVPKELEKLVNKAMAKEPGQRYASWRIIAPCWGTALKLSNICRKPRI
jgi:hypothetical protein